MCPSLACLDVKMYNFLNSEACVCTVEDLKTIRGYASDAQGHLKVALIGESQNLHKQQQYIRLPEQATCLVLCLYVKLYTPLSSEACV